MAELVKQDLRGVMGSPVILRFNFGTFTVFPEQVFRPAAPGRELPAAPEPLTYSHNDQTIAHTSYNVFLKANAFSIFTFLKLRWI